MTNTEIPYRTTVSPEDLISVAGEFARVELFKGRRQTFVVLEEDLCMAYFALRGVSSLLVTSGLVKEAREIIGRETVV